MNVTLDFDEKNLIHTLAIASIHDSYKILAMSSSRKNRKYVRKNRKEKPQKPSSLSRSMCRRYKVSESSLQDSNH